MQLAEQKQVTNEGARVINWQSSISGIDPDLLAAKPRLCRALRHVLPPLIAAWAPYLRQRAISFTGNR